MRDFAHELTVLRDHARLTIRQFAATADARSIHSTIGDWFAGRTFPSTGSPDLLVPVLRACGVTDAFTSDRRRLCPTGWIALSTKSETL
jgi:hypothetical protein